MSVYIQSKIPPRQAKEKYPSTNDCAGKIMKLDVTSGQKKDNLNRLAFSPMSEYPGRYYGFYCFENFWQSGKRYQDAGHMDINKKLNDIKYWKGLNAPHRRHPKFKGKILDSIHPDIFPDNRTFNYIDSRKHVYVPLYFKDIINGVGLDQFLYWKNLVNEGKTVVVVDYDGPRNPSLIDGVIYERPCLQVTREMLIEKINDPSAPFGHGYVVAAALLGINPEEYTQITEAPGAPKATQSPKAMQAPKAMQSSKKIRVKLKPMPRPITNCTCCKDTIT